MKFGYARISRTDGPLSIDLQIDGLVRAGVKPSHIYRDKASGNNGQRPGLQNCLKALREGDVLVVWKLDRLGLNLRHLVNTVQGLCKRGVGIKVLTGQGAIIDTATVGGKIVLGVFAALSEFDRDMIRERTKAGLEAARARGRRGGRKFVLSQAQVRYAQAAMGRNETVVGELCRELGVARATLYRYVGPNGDLRDYGRRVLSSK